MIEFLYGPDVYRLKSHAKNHCSQSGLTWNAFDLSDSNQAKLFLSEISSGSLFSQPSFLYGYNTFDADPGVLKYIKSWLMGDKANVECVFAYNKPKEIIKKIDKKLFDILTNQEICESHEFSYLEKASIAQFAKDIALGYGIKIANPVAQTIIAGCEIQDPKTRKTYVDAGQLVNAIERCALYAKASGREIINNNDLTLLLPNLPTNVFSCIDAIMSSDIKNAVPLVTRYTEEQDGAESFFYLLCSQMKNLFVVRSMLDAKKNPDEINQKIGLHPYVFQKTLRLAQRYNEPQLRLYYSKLIDADLSIRTGRINHDQGLWSFIYSL